MENIWSVNKSRFHLYNLGIKYFLLLRKNKYVFHTSNFSGRTFPMINLIVEHAILVVYDHLPYYPMIKRSSHWIYIVSFT